MNWKLLPASLLLIGGLIFPLFLLISLSAHEPESGALTIEHYQRFFVDWNGLDLILFTLIFAVCVTLFTVAIGYVLGLGIVQWPLAIQRWVLMMLLIPKLSNLLAIVFGIHELVSADGPLNQWLISSGILATHVVMVQSIWLAGVVEVYLLLPYAILLFTMHFQRREPLQLRVASLLGASTWKVFWLITWPQSRPTIWFTTTLTLIWACGAFAGPVFLGGPRHATLSSDLYRQAFTNLDISLAAVEGVCLLVLVTCLMMGNRHIQKVNPS